MKDVFEQLAFVKPMVDIGNPRVQEAGVWGMVFTLASLFTGAFRFLSEEVMGVSILFTIILFVISIIFHKQVNFNRFYFVIGKY